MYPLTLKEKDVYVWGGGRKGKKLTKELQSQGIILKGILTNNANKVGHRFCETSFIRDNIIETLGYSSLRNSFILMGLSSPNDLKAAIRRLQVKDAINYVRML